MIDLPRDCYRFKDAENKIREEGDEFFEIEGVDYSGEILIHVKDAMFPYKAYVPHHVLWATNTAKSILIEFARLMSKKRFILSAAFTVGSVKRLEELLVIFNRLAHRILSPYVLKDWHLSKFSQELHLWVFSFMLNLGISEEISDEFAMYFVHVIEYDDAYKMRIKDLLSETSKKRLTNPRTEIRRLVRILMTRDHEGIARKFTWIADILSIALFIPKVKKAFAASIRELDFDLLKLDDSDKYWVTLKKDYRYMGMSHDERKGYALSRGWTYPEAKR